MRIAGVGLGVAVACSGSVTGVCLVIVVGGTSTAGLSAICVDRPTRVGAGVVLTEVDAEFLGDRVGTGGGGKLSTISQGHFPAPIAGRIGIVLVQTSAAADSSRNSAKSFCAKAPA